MLSDDAAYAGHWLLDNKILCGVHLPRGLDYKKDWFHYPKCFEVYGNAGSK